MKRQGPFTLNHYSELLRELKKSNYQFIGFTQAEQFLAKNEPFILLRHDIDLDISATLLMAHLESEEGIRSTYYFLVRSDIYNIFSDESGKVLRELMSLGHTVSIHFDCAIYPRSIHLPAVAIYCQARFAIIKPAENDVSPSKNA